MHCFYCFWSQTKLSCVSFNLLTRFSIFTLRLSAPLSRSLTPSSAQESLPHGLYELRAHLFLRMQADSPESTRPKPSLPEKTPIVCIEPLTSEHSAILHPPTTVNSHTHTNTHTHTPSQSLSPATIKCHPSLWPFLMNHSHQWQHLGISWHHMMYLKMSSPLSQTGTV